MGLSDQPRGSPHNDIGNSALSYFDESSLAEIYWVATSIYRNQYAIQLERHCINRPKLSVSYCLYCLLQLTLKQVRDSSPFGRNVTWDCEHEACTLFWRVILTIVKQSDLPIRPLTGVIQSIVSSLCAKPLKNISLNSKTNDFNRMISAKPYLESIHYNDDRDCERKCFFINL